METAARAPHPVGSDQAGRPSPTGPAPAPISKNNPGQHPPPSQRPTRRPQHGPIDNAFTHPWTVDKRYRRDRTVLWFEDNCTENNHHVVIGKENYFVSGDGYLMPVRKDQKAPDLRYFKPAQK